MKPIKCPHGSCRKEFEQPIVVTNFSFMPQKETYYACPYCLTKIGALNEDCSHTLVTFEEQVNVENNIEEQTLTPERNLQCSGVPQTATLKTLANLEKEKADLLAQLDALRKEAAKKVSNLEEEVSALREEAEALKKLTEN